MYIECSWNRKLLVTKLATKIIWTICVHQIIGKLGNIFDIKEKIFKSLKLFVRLETHYILIAEKNKTTLLKIIRKVPWDLTLNYRNIHVEYNHYIPITSRSLKIIIWKFNSVFILLWKNIQERVLYTTSELKGCVSFK